MKRVTLSQDNGGIIEDKSLISVIIPVYNGEKYLAEAVETVLAQTYRPIEVIIVDDGSTDGSRKIAQCFGRPVCYSFKSHQGLGAARNHGITMARGGFCAFLDADDLWVENKLTRQIAVFGDKPHIDMVFGYAKLFHSPELSEQLKARLDGAGQTMPGLHAGTLLIKRESFFRAGLFETGWRLGEFIDWYLKAIEKGLKGYTLPEVVMQRRLHGGNMTIRERPAMLEYVRVLKASLDRRRAGA
jgi:glycosyltransferase involved in cell wall biosynthesis